MDMMTDQKNPFTKNVVVRMTTKAMKVRRRGKEVAA